VGYQKQIIRAINHCQGRTSVPWQLPTKGLQLRLYEGKRALSTPGMSQDIQATGATASSINSFTANQSKEDEEIRYDSGLDANIRIPMMMGQVEQLFMPV
jgi:hypothetical protein